MSVVGQGLLGLGLAVAGWAIPRHVAGARRVSAATALDAAPLGFVVALLFALLGKPVFAGAVAFALGAGFAFADRTMRETLREPVVFTALSELPQLFTHPHLYLPFAGTGLVVGGTALAVAAGVVLALGEPAIWGPHPVVALVLAALVCGLQWRVGCEPWLGRAATSMRRLWPSGEPFDDARRLGPVAMLIAHGIIARAERPARRAGLAAPAIGGSHAATRPVVIVQCESFFDARRALPDLPRDWLPGFDAACEGGSHGRLIVPAWGANTMRAEFAVLTGIAEAQLGYDRFNPYHALARRTVPSQIWRLRAAGYRTICLHPFDRRFFRRDLAMPALGFEVFLGRETLGGSRAPPYLSDPELARHILRVLDTEGPRTCIFAITMGNHGPWLKDFTYPGAKPRLEWDALDRDVPQRAELLRYLDRLRQSDEMLRLLIEGLSRRGDATLLGFYGDHLPSLPRAFAHLGFDDWRSDYAVWSAAGVSVRRNLQAYELGRTIVDIALAPRNSSALDAVVAETHDA